MMCLVVSFTFFKHGFVRQDSGHAYHFFSIIYVILIIAFIMMINNGRQNKKNIGKVLLGIKCYMLIILVISTFVLIPFINEMHKPGAKYNLLEKPDHYKKALLFLYNETYFSNDITESQERIVRKYKASQEMFDEIQNDSVDIIPWDIALIWAQNLNWSPRPIFQSYTSYTQEVDNMNAIHFEGDEAPKFIIYSYKSIDGRYPIFDEPKTFRNILCNYEYLNRYDKFIILQFNHDVRNCSGHEEITYFSANVGDSIQVPNFKNGYLFGYIDLNYSNHGRFMNVIYKSSPAYIQFEFMDGSYSKKFRFVPDTAKNGIFLSKYAGNIHDLALIFRGQIITDIRSIKITVENSADYEKEMKIRFVGIPAKIQYLE